jgi:hypothetical protein
MISPINGKSAGFFRSEHATYSDVFSHVATVQAHANVREQVAQNLIMVAGHSEELMNRTTAAMNGARLSPPSGGLILTDDYAPVEQLLQQQ